MSARQASLEAVVRSTHHRLWARAILVELARILPWSFALFAAFCALFRVGWIDRLGLLGGAAVLFSVVLVRVYRAVGRAPSPLGAALLLDRTHGAMGRLATTWEVNRRDQRAGSSSGDLQSPKDGFFLVVEEELFRMGPFLPRNAAPLPFPRGLWLALGTAAVAGVVLLAPIPAARPPQMVVAAPTPTQEEHWLSEDDGELLHETAAKLIDETESEEGKEVAARFNEIVLSVVSGKLTQKEAFQMAAELEADLEGTAEEAAELHRGLKRRGESLAERKATREVGEALREQRYADAAEALKKLAERLRSGDQGLSKKELEELRESLEELRKNQQQEAEKSESGASDAQREALSRRKKELEEKQKQGKATSAEKKELEETERQLKRLDRQKAAQNQAKNQAQKTLSELDKQLAAAAQALMEEQKKSGQFLDQAGQTVSQSAQRTLSDEEKKELVKQLKELKERLRRQQKDQNQKERLKNFQKRARGQGQPGGQQGGEGQKSKKPGELQVRFGPGGVPIPGTGKSPGKPGEGEGEGEAASASNEPGHGHDPQVAGEESRLEGAHAEDAMAVAQDSGKGQSASETIVTAAEEGFSHGSYEKLYRKYETVAEEVMERESIPPGRKAHVRRYFELIRPRGDAPVPQKEK